MKNKKIMMVKNKGHISEHFEGVNSSLYRAFVNTTKPDWKEEFDKHFSDGDFKRMWGWTLRDKIKSFIQTEIDRAVEEVLEKVDKEVIGGDEKFTIVGHKYGTETGEIEKMIGDGEEDWKIPRNELRQEQRQILLKFKKGEK